MKVLELGHDLFPQSTFHIFVARHAYLGPEIIQDGAKFSFCKGEQIRDPLCVRTASEPLSVYVCPAMFSSVPDLVTTACLEAEVLYIFKNIITHLNLGWP